MRAKKKKMPPEGGVKEEEVHPQRARAGTGVDGSSRPSTKPRRAKNWGAKLERRKDEQEEDTEKEVMTRGRMDTPSGIGDGVAAQYTRFTFSRAMGAVGSGEEDCADPGESDGEGGAIPCAIPERLVLRPLKRFGGGIPTAKSAEDKEGNGRSQGKRRKEYEIHQLGRIEAKRGK